MFRFMPWALAAVFISAAGPAGAAGIQQISLNTGGGALKGAVWYPCAAPPGTVSFRSVEMQGVRDCPIAGQNLPLIVISHGARGWFGGHHGTAAALASAGFAVAAVTHPDKDRRKWRTARPAAVSALIDYLHKKWRGREHLDADRTGFFGFSRGGYTGLVLAGGVPDFRRMLWRCLISLWRDPMCRPPKGAKEDAKNSGESEDGREDENSGGGRRDAAEYTADPRINAAVIAAPVGAVFSDKNLAGVSIPVQLWRAEKDELLLYPHHAEAVYEALPEKPDYHVVKGAGHFAFMPPCGAALTAAAPMLCADNPGFGRAAFHKNFNAQIVEFFRKFLPRPQPE